MHDELKTTDFSGVDFDAVIPTNYYSCWLVDREYRSAAKKAIANGSKAKARVYEFLADVCSMSFNPASNSLFSPQFIYEVKRSAMSADFKKHSDIFNWVIVNTNNDVLRARFSDVLWENDNDYRAAKIALNSYLKILSRITINDFSKQGNPVSLGDTEAINILTRCLQLSRIFDKKQTYSTFTYISKLIEISLEHSVENGFISDFICLGELSLNYKLPHSIGVLAKKCISNTSDAYRQTQLWRLAKRSYHISDAQDEKHKCSMEIASCLLKQANTLPQNGNSLAKANYIEEAIMELRSTPETRAKRYELKKTLLEVQEKIPDEMISSKYEYDATQIATDVRGFIQKPTFIESIKKFVYCHTGLIKSEIEKNAAKTANSFFFQVVGSHSLADRKGRTVMKYPAHDFGSAEIPIHLIHRNAGLHWEMTSQAIIEVGRVAISQSFNLNESDFHILLSHSPFVPRDRIHTFAKGFTEYFRGNLMSAINILVPQLKMLFAFISINVISKRLSYWTMDHRKSAHSRSYFH